MKELLFQDYILIKKYRLLYYLYEHLYGLVLISKDKVCEWELQEAVDGFNATAEIASTKLLPLNQKIKIHKQHYKRLVKEYPIHPGVNGFYNLF